MLPPVEPVVSSPWLYRITLMLALVLFLLFIWGGNQPEAAGLIPPPWDKLIHLAWFTVLAGLLYFGLGLRHRAWVVMFCVSVALWDEWRQLTLPGRSAGLDDLLFDGLGIGVGAWLAGWLGVLFSSFPEREKQQE